MDEANMHLEHVDDQRDSEAWVRHWMDEHPDKSIEVINGDWVAAQVSILNRSSPGLSVGELISQLDEKARRQTEPELSNYEHSSYSFFDF